MSTETFLSADRCTEIHYHAWLPEGTPRAVLVLFSRDAEHSARYAEFKAALNAQGFAVYAQIISGTDAVFIRKICTATSRTAAAMACHPRLSADAHAGSRCPSQSAAFSHGPQHGLFPYAAAAASLFAAKIIRRHPHGQRPSGEGACALCPRSQVQLRATRARGTKAMCSIS